MLTYISLGADVLASLALVISVIFLLKELRLTRDTMSHADFLNSINRSAENMLRITENDELLSTIEKISAYRNQQTRDARQLRQILDELSPREHVRYFHFQRNACLNCEVFLESANAGYIDSERFAMAFGWTAIDFEIWQALGLGIGVRTCQHFGSSGSVPLPLYPADEAPFSKGIVREEKVA